MFGIGVGELLVVLLIALLLFGNRLPGAARSLGQALSAFRGEVRNLEEEVTVPLR
jgi:TatA/E family protein of Tat protein translocase